MVVQVSQKTMKITDRVSVIGPHNRESLTFVGQDAVGRQRVRHGGQNSLMKVLKCPVVHTPSDWSATFLPMKET